MLEPDARKRARPVLRGAGRSNASGLPGEIVGQFKNGGKQWRPAGDPEQVNVHDFMDKDLGKAIPYGVYDMAANTGWVNVGIDHETAAFAVNTIRSWWNTAGKATYPAATRLLITADSGGSNGSRRRTWKTELAALAAQTGLQISVCHLPPGTSKWNKIEHRLFAQITRNWQGTPLTDHETIINLIGTTTTTTGLKVTAELDTADYPTGIHITDTEMRKLPLSPDNWHGEWNYTLYPSDTPRKLT